LALLLPWLPLAAQQPGEEPLIADSVSVNVLSSRIAVGEIGQLFIQVRNAEATMPERIDADGLTVDFSGSQTSMKYINGVQSAETTYFYRFRGDKPGTYAIPEFQIQVGKQTALIKSIPITVLENNRSDTSTIDATKPYFAKLELVRDTFYVNELVPFTLTAHVRGRNTINDVVSAKLEHESFVLKGFREVRTSGAEVGNSYYSSAVIPSHLFALKPGTHQLGPAEIVVRVVDSDSGFGLSSFFQRTAAREMATNTVAVTVKPLPDGAPASFSGGVGQFQLTGKPTITTLAVGDPVTMEFEVTGVGNLRTMGAPVFGIPQKGIWKSYDASKDLKDEDDSDGFRSGSIHFSQVLIPEARTEAIPEFHLTYFDPAKEKYETLKVGPFSVTITDDRSGAAPTAIRFPSESPAAEILSSASRPAPTFQDVMHIRTGTPRWVATGPGPHPGAFFYLVQVLCSIAFCTVAGLGIVRWYRRRQPRADLPLSALPFSKARKRIPKAGAPRRDFFQAVLIALESWQREHPDAPAPLLEDCRRVSQQCSETLYSGKAETSAPIGEAEVSRFASFLRRLSKP
ncbi:MAG TPA: BatD family protein, partial [Bacteroidia bacterium]|nr:BatD family protein [Bacteroidia bacterium]